MGVGEESFKSWVWKSSQLEVAGKTAAEGIPPPYLLTLAPKVLRILALGPRSCFVGECILYLCDGENRRGGVYATQQAAEGNRDISVGGLRQM